MFFSGKDTTRPPWFGPKNPKDTPLPSGMPLGVKTDNVWFPAMLQGVWRVLSGIGERLSDLERSFENRLPTIEA
jgi:hypothetical protein